jgi:hypothetical protein
MNDESRAPFVALIDIMLIALFLTFRGFKEGVKKIYEIEERYLSEQTIKQLKSESCDVTYPVNAEDGKILHYIKYFFTKVIPPAIVISCFLIYLYLK